MQKQVKCLLGAWVLVVIIVLCLSAPVQAQGGDPWSNLATIEAQATISALDAANNASSAQGQAAQLEAQAQQAAAAAAAARARVAQQAALATHQAVGYANVQAQAQATVNAAVQATRAANEARATEQAINAMATAIRQEQVMAEQAISATATSQASDAQATRTAYELTIEETKKRSDFGMFLLYIAGLAAMAMTIWLVITWVRQLMRQNSAVEQADQPARPPVEPGPVIIDATPIAGGTLPEQGGRIARVNVIDHPGAVSWLREYIRQYGIGADDDE